MKSLEFSENCSGEFLVTVEDLGKQEEIVIDATPADLEGSDTLDITETDLTTNTGDYIEVVLEDAILPTELCASSETSVTGFVLSIPENTKIVKLNNLKGFLQSTKITELNVTVVNSQNQVLTKRSYTNTEKLDRMISNIEDASFLIVYYSSATKCKNDKLTNFQVKFF